MARKRKFRTHRLDEENIKIKRYGRKRELTYMDMKSLFKANNEKELLNTATKIYTAKEGKAAIKKALRSKRLSQSDLGIKTILEDTAATSLTEGGVLTAKRFFIDGLGMDQRTVDKCLIFDQENHTIQIRGELRDTLDYEYYGVPVHTWPNVQRIKYWIKNRVIRRDPMLRKIWTGLRGMDSKEEKQGMLDDLAFLFSRAIFRDGLKKRSTTHFEEVETPGEQEPISLKWNGKQVTLKKLKEEEFIGKKYGSYRSKWRSRQ